MTSTLKFDHMGFFMNILQYLQTKYRMEQPNAITHAEAEAFGIPYPLKHGWLIIHGPREVDDFMLSRIKKKLNAKIKRGGKKGRKLSPYHQYAVSMIENKSGPVAYPKISNYSPPSGKPPKSRYVDPNSPDFLSSYAWRTLRMQALKLYGAICMCCGDSPSNGAVMNVDHIKPRKHFPNLALDIANLQILCNSCNQGKGNWDETDWRPTEPDGLSYDPLDQVKDILKNIWEEI
jgi:5-methylcytosine-specific restriction endonuclease McrA